MNGVLSRGDEHERERAHRRGLVNPAGRPMAPQHVRLRSFRGRALLHEHVACAGHAHRVIVAIGRIAEAALARARTRPQRFG